MRQPVGAKKIIRQAPNVRVVDRQVVGAPFDDGNQPRLIGQPSRQIDTDIRHLARGSDFTGVTRTLRAGGTLRIPGSRFLLGTRQAALSANIGLSSHPESRKVWLAI